LLQQINRQLFFACNISEDETYALRKLQGFLTLLEEAFVLVKSLFITLKTSIPPKIPNAFSLTIVLKELGKKEGER